MPSSHRSRRSPSGSRRGKSVAGRILLSLLGLVTLFLVVAVFLPSRFQLEREIVVNAPPDAVLAQITNLKQWPEWTVWNRQSDPTLTISYSGRAEGPGASSKWDGKKTGPGAMTITENSASNGIKYDLTLMGGNFHGGCGISFEKESDGTRLVWSIDGGLGINPITRYRGLLLKRQFGQDMQESLQRLKSNLETTKARSAP